VPAMRTNAAKIARALPASAPSLALQREVTVSLEEKRLFVFLSLRQLVGDLKPRCF
jgi:hypothetical protein